ncbi:PilZ domain-containing protein [Altererythrobacter lutimaris]|uniref:PilZ domain-containing protein n=1 Tax=Altererythrobacter lutimaris TaxID=2743979 RepID=A0A850H814_9SPHN|nr:PilZ domain-containing protein [Altererythrobacter lutimaris]NVE93670.1 PilZ domain-containing protein [Altererythrobacter lutimaris]
MDNSSHGRQSLRRPLDILVDGRMRSRPICVELLDMSEGGCKIKGRHGFAEVGEHLSLNINGVRTPLGKVVWVDDQFAGVAFEGKMHEAIVDHLSRETLAKKQDSERRANG